MIQKERKLVITFHTTTQAMAMERCCKQEGAPGRLIPVPRAITAGCGLAWCTDPEDEQFMTPLMEENSIEPEGIYRCLI